jgi:MoaA/NifB/PqqE/SkfB family radical SAM enzyme
MSKVEFLQIEPTTRCNFRCKFCSGRYLEQGDLNLNNIKSVVAEFHDLQHVLLQGEGEPLLNDDFFRMVELIKSKKTKIFTVTNGSMFTREIIKKIVESQPEAINISIEWPTNKEFNEFRGGNLEKILTGIKALRTARDQSGSKYPVIGFSVTILKDTILLFDKIIELYNELKMDGGIQYQFLNSKDTYTVNYDAYLKSQILTAKDESDFKEHYAEILSIINDKKNHLNFYEDMLKTHTAENTDFKGYDKSCELIENSLYIDFRGYITACCMVKDIQKYSFGRVGEISFNELNAKRKAAATMIRTGNMPDFCNECYRAIDIKTHLDELCSYKPKVNMENLQGKTAFGKPINSFYSQILNMCDGQKNCMEIVQQISKVYSIDMLSAENLILPKIDELLSKDVLYL